MDRDCTAVLYLVDTFSCYPRRGEGVLAFFSLFFFFSQIPDVSLFAPSALDFKHLYLLRCGFKGPKVP